MVDGVSVDKVVVDSHRGLPLPRRTRAIICVSIGSLLLTVDSSISAVVLPSIAKALQIENASAVFIVTVYQLILSMTLLPFAALGDRIGHRRLYQAGLILHSVAAALCFFADSLLALIVVRALQSLGTAAAMSTAVGLLRGIYPTERLGRGLAINTIANACGSALAPVLAGFLISHVSWQWVFIAVVPFSMASLSLSRALPDSEPRQHRFDLIGTALCALTFGLLISGLESAIHSSHLLLAIGIFACGVIVAYFFIRHEKNESNPVLPVDLLAIPTIGFAVLAGFSGIVAVMVLLLSLPFRLQHQYGFGPAEIGGIVAAYMIVSSFISSVSGFLSDRISVKWLSTVGMVLAAIGLLFVVFLPEHPSHFDLLWPIWIAAFGFGLFFSPNVRQVVMASPLKRAASAGSLNNTVRMLGYTVSATVVAGLFAVGLGDGAVPGLVSAALALTAAIISFFNPRVSDSKKS